MICTSGAFNNKLFLYDSEEVRIGCVESGEIKALGMCFGSGLDRFGMSHQLTVDAANLRTNGFSSAELIQVYKAMIRPVVEYGWVVYQDKRLNQLQNHALKGIFGLGISTRKMRDLAGIETLRQRRERTYGINLPLNV